MKNIENKKISIKVILSSLLGIIISTFIKKPTIYEDGSVSDTNFSVDVFFIDLDYELTIVILLIILGVGVYSYLLKTDDIIKSKTIFYFNNVKNQITQRISSLKLLVNEEEAKKFNKMNRIKNICLVSGIILLGSQNLIEDYFQDSAKEEIKALNINYNPYNLTLAEKMEDKNYFKVSSIDTKYKAYSSFFKIFNIIVALTLIGFVKDYNVGHWVIWGLISLVIPNITLIIMGLNFTLKKEYKLKYNLIKS